MTELFKKLNSLQNILDINIRIYVCIYELHVCVHIYIHTNK
jgi:hypothetical protein